MEVKSLIIKDMTIAYQQWGNPEGEPLLALHGWMDNSASFEFIAPYLSKYNVVAVDLPGHGLSGHLPESCHYHVWSVVEDIELIADQLGWPIFHILGHSMGGAVASFYSATFPNRVRSMITVDALGLMAGDLNQAPKRMADAIIQMKSYNSKQTVLPDKTPFITARMAGTLKLEKPAATAIVERAIRHNGRGFSWTTDKRLKITSMMRLPEEMIQSFLGQIQAPVCGIFASDGLFSKTRLQNRWDCLSEPKEWHWLKGGHHLHMEGDLKLIGDTICQFLSKNVIELESS